MNNYLVGDFAWAHWNGPYETKSFRKMSDFEDCSDDIQCLGRCITVKPFNTPKMKTCVVFLFELKLSLYLAFINVSSKQDPSIFKKNHPPPLTTFSKLADMSTIPNESNESVVRGQVSTNEKRAARKHRGSFMAVMDPWNPPMRIKTPETWRLGWWWWKVRPKPKPNLPT